MNNYPYWTDTMGPDSHADSAIWHVDSISDDNPSPGWIIGSIEDLGGETGSAYAPDATCISDISTISWTHFTFDYIKLESTVTCEGKQR